MHLTRREIQGKNEAMQRKSKKEPHMQKEFSYFLEKKTSCKFQRKPLEDKNDKSLPQKKLRMKVPRKNSRTKEASQEN